MSNEKYVTVRIDYQLYEDDPNKQAYPFVVGGEKVWLPKGSVKVTPNGKFLDLDMPQWLANNKGLKEEVVAEYYD